VPLESVNGVAIHGMEDVVTALETPQGGMHVFHFGGLESDYVMRADQRAPIDERIAEKYKIPRLRYLDGDPE
jgi:hypothetical protein